MSLKQALFSASVGGSVGQKIGPKCKSTRRRVPMTWHLHMHLSCWGAFESCAWWQTQMQLQIQILRYLHILQIRAGRQAAALAPSHYFNYLFTQGQQTCWRHLSCLVSASSLKVTSCCFFELWIPRTGCWLLAAGSWELAENKAKAPN